MEDFPSSKFVDLEGHSLSYLLTKISPANEFPPLFYINQAMQAMGSPPIFILV
jgi:hypothetical protein